MTTTTEEPDPLANVRRVIVVSNVLPVQLIKSPKTKKWAVQFDTNALFEDGPILTGISNCIQNAIFVGVPPVNVPPNEREEVQHVLARKRCHPVYVPAKEASLHYQGLCKSIFWPLFHNIIDLYNEVQIQALYSKYDASRPQTPLEEGGSWHPARSFNPQEIEILWPAHMDFVMKFRSVILSLYSEGDLIWIHDYHLMMLVGPLRRLLPQVSYTLLTRKITNEIQKSAPIGIFLHIPFPSSEVFRCLSKRNEVLESILQADHVGFHSYEYARHFLTGTQRILGYAYGAQRGGVFGIRTGKGRTVTLTTAHAGLDMISIQATLNKTSTSSIFPPSIKGVIVICGVDEIEGLRGVALKLLAFDRLLTNCPALKKRIVLKQVGIKLDSRPHDYKRCFDEIDRLVNQLNEKWGDGSVLFEVVTSFSLEQRLSLYADSDILLQTCVRWGLSVDAMEFVVANKARAKQAANFIGSGDTLPPRGPGVVVASEFVSCSRVLSGSIKINPWSIEETAKVLEQAATMSLEEKTARCFRDLGFVEKNTVVTWARCVLRDLAACSLATSKCKETSLMSYGLGVGMRAVGVGEGKLQRLNTNQICESYFNSKHIRALVLDYSGTLVATTPADVFLKSGGQARAWHYSKDSLGSEHARYSGGSLETRDPVSPQVVKSLQILSNNPRNRIVIMSMDLRDELFYALKNIPNLILVAENGYATYLNGEWRQLVEEDDAGGDWYGGQAAEVSGMDTWQKDVQTIIDVYVERTSGAFTFTAPSSVTFNYLLADPELGEHQSKSLALQLETRISGLPLVLELGKGTVTVRNRTVNRGAVLTQLLKLLPETCDFVACFGDDVEDELMFRAAIDSKIENVFTCRIGLKGASDETRAKYYLDDEDDVAELLEKLSEDSNSFRPSNNTTSTDNDNTQVASTKQTPFNMLPGGFVTKKSLLSLSTMTNNNANENLLNIGSPLRTKHKLTPPGLHTTPSMGTFDDLPPAPTSIPILVHKMDTSEEHRTNNKTMIKRASSASSTASPSQSPPPSSILNKLTGNSSSFPSASASPSPSPPITIDDNKRVNSQQQQLLQKQQEQAKNNNNDNQIDNEVIKLAAAAIFGAIVTSVFFLVVSSSFGKKKI